MGNGMARLRQSAWALLLCCGLGAAQAQQGMRFIESTAIEDCLAPAAAQRGEPDYPERAYAENRSAKVQARLVFTGPEDAPDVEIKSNSRDVDFEREVRKYLDRYRMPCMKKGQAALSAEQQFVFTAHDRRVSVSKNMAAHFFSEHSECLNDIELRYPTQLTRKAALGQDPAEQANVILDITFKKRGEAPEIRTVYGGGDRMLEAAAVDSARDYRYQCEITDAKGLTGRQTFTFLIQDGARARFQNMDIRGLLKLAEKSSWVGAKFDTNTMACPFDLRVTMYQPADKNWVSELDTRNPDRQAFIDWIRNMAFKVPKKVLPMLMGDSFDLHVPCVSFDLS